jgi:transcriptional regulator with XRE-family HTH domain
MKEGQMPRPNPQRSIASEASLARRIAFEREERGWSYDGLASRMTQAGCPINASALYKIEKGDPPRRITVDELVALSRVFGIKLPGLLAPPEKVLNRQLLKLLENMGHAIDQTLAANEAYKDSLRDLARFALDQPEAAKHFDQIEGFSLGLLIETLRDVDTDEDQRLVERLERLG